MSLKGTRRRLNRAWRFHLPPYPHQVEGVDFFRRAGGRAVCADDMALGKGHPAGTRILTPNGWKKIEDLQPDELLVGRDGRPVRLLNVFDRGELPVYRVTFRGRESVLTDGEHLWRVFRAAAKHVYRIRDTRELARDLFDAAGNPKWYIPICEPVRVFPKRGFYLDPYLLGVLLGDGNLSKKGSISFCCGDELVPREVAKVLPHGVRLQGDKNSTPNWSFPCSGKRTRNPVKGEVKRLGLLGTYSHNKFVPEEYAFSSRKQRLALLQGLMDTDGTIVEETGAAFSSSSEQLVSSVQWLVESLGGTCRRDVRKEPVYSYKGEHRVGLPSFEVNAIRLPRGLNPFRARPFVPQTRNPPSRAVVSVKQEGTAHVYCLSVAAADQLYLTEHCIVTHNTGQVAGYIAITPDALPAVVVCPATIKEQWRRALLAFAALRSHACEGEVRTPEEDETSLERSMARLTKGYRRTKAWREAKARFEEGRSRARTASQLRRRFLAARRRTLRRELRRRQADQASRLRAAAAAAQRGEVLVVNYEVLDGWEPFLSSLKLRLVAFDECHRIKTRGAACTKAASRLAKRARHRLALSGTPIDNRPVEFWPVLRIVRPDVFTSFAEFAFQFCAPTPTGFRGRMEYKGASNLKELHRLLRPIMIRRRKRDVLKDLPPKRRIVVPLEINNRRSYERAQEDFLEWLEEEEGEGAVRRAAGAMALVRMAKLKLLAARGKLKHVVTWIEDWLEETDGKLVVFAIHREVLDTLKAAFPSAALVYGGVSGVKRQAEVDRFCGKRGCRLFLTNLRSGGVGLDGLQHASSTTLTLEIAWNESAHLQAEDRVLRPGQKASRCENYYLVARDTIEEWLLEVVQQKQVVVDQVLEGRSPKDRRSLLEMLGEGLKR